VLATGISGFTYGAVTQWMPSFLSRSYHLSSFTIGAWMAPCIGIGGGLGTLVSGRLVDRLQARDQRWIGWIPALALAGCAIPEAIAFAQHDVLLSLLTLCVPIILVPMHLAPFSAVVQGIGDARSRGTGVAMSLLITTTIGGGIGAQLIGLASDLLRPSLGEESLRYALLILVPLGAALASLCFMRGARTLPADLRRPTPSM
jgi:predicted MFS family arabinose efflux permease